MANEFITRNGLIIVDSDPVSGITNNHSGLTYNPLFLVTEYAVKKELEKYYTTAQTYSKSEINIISANTFTLAVLSSQTYVNNNFTTKIEFNSHTGATNPHNTSFTALTYTSHTHLWSDIKSTPTTISGYGITDAFRNGGDTGTSNRSLGNNDNYSLSFKTSNINRVFITSGGSMGIGSGNTNPQEMLDVSGDIKIGGTSGGTLRAELELIMRQDGDIYGSSILRLRNRAGENGAIYETTNPTITLVDFIFKTAIGQRNIRYENRLSFPNTFIGTTYPEFQLGQAANPTLVINDTSILVRGTSALSGNTNIYGNTNVDGSMVVLNNLTVSASTKLNILSLQSGQTGVFGISNNSALTNSSETYLVTENAVKQYVDYQLSFIFDGIRTGGQAAPIDMLRSGLATSTTPFIVPYDAILVAISIATSVAETWTGSILQNGTSIASVSAAGTTSAYNGNLSINVNAGDAIRLRMTANTGTISNPAITAFFKKR